MPEFSISINNGLIVASVIQESYLQKMTSHRFLGGDVSNARLVNYQHTILEYRPIFRTPGLLLELKIQLSPVGHVECWLSMESMAIIIIYSVKYSTLITERLYQCSIYPR